MAGDHNPSARNLEIEMARVRQANRQFYQAMESLDMDEMESVWLDSASCRCIHPGGPMLIGWDDIRESWRAIFQTTNTLQITLHEVTVHIEGSVAWVTCFEHLVTTTEKHSASAVLCASNLFVMVDAEWRLVLHHTSPVGALDDAESNLVQ